MSDLSLFNSFSPTIKTPKRTRDNAVIYTRVSSLSQEENTSLESQKKYCELFAQRRALNVIEYFGGTHESAKTDDRKEFNKMLAFIKRNKSISYIIVYSYERFPRSGINGAKIASDLLHKQNIKTLSVSQDLDPSTASGLFQQNIFFLFSQMDNDLRRDKTVTGMRELLRKGYCPWSIPRGYTNLAKGKAVNQQIVVNEDGEFIKKANEKMRNVDIANKLNRQGFNIEAKRLSSILNNPFYCGIIVNRMIPGEVILGKHEALISYELFLKANGVISSNRTQPVTHNFKNNNLPLKRFMKCVCGKSMTGYLVAKKNLYYYSCPRTGCHSNKSAINLHEQFQKILADLKMNTQVQPLVEEGIRIIYNEVCTNKIDDNHLLKMKKNDLLLA